MSCFQIAAVKTAAALYKCAPRLSARKLTIEFGKDQKIVAGQGTASSNRKAPRPLRAETCRARCGLARFGRERGQHQAPRRPGTLWSAAHGLLVWCRSDSRSRSDPGAQFFATWDRAAAVDPRRGPGAQGPGGADRSGNLSVDQADRRRRNKRGQFSGRDRCQFPQAPRSRPRIADGPGAGMQDRAPAIICDHC